VVIAVGSQPRKELQNALADKGLLEGIERIRLIALSGRSNEQKISKVLRIQAPKSYFGKIIPVEEVASLSAGQRRERKSRQD
jgi:hypothetical protein